MIANIINTSEIIILGLTTWYIWYDRLEIKTNPKILIVFHTIISLISSSRRSELLIAFKVIKTKITPTMPLNLMNSVNNRTNTSNELKLFAKLFISLLIENIENPIWKKADKK
ncbi:hypothetical protein [Spiroplasma helicoides]|uniref:hypothetical protein n=1 Tax=Spiroplasma helicoides TaxID=216938 RepID=UPI0018DD587E|nr:hypothetical protein [Spiroplasma helicoides]